MPEVHIVAIFSPRPGKVERVSLCCPGRRKRNSLNTFQVRELLTAQCQEVHEKEDYALRFLVTEQIDVEVPELILFETYETVLFSLQSVKAVANYLSLL